MYRKLLSADVQYRGLVERILNEGSKIKGRNGDVYSIFGHQMVFSLRNNELPLLTTKKVAWKTCLRELLWFVRGDTHNSNLQAKNVKIWNGNSTREFLDSRGLSHYEEGELGPIYGFQWRNFGGDYTRGWNIHKAKMDGTNDKYTQNGVDQLDWIIRSLQNTGEATPECENRWSRRLIVSAWNPLQIPEMALPPCHVLFQFHVDSETDELSCSLYQRSGDVGLGVPFNIASYSMLTIWLAFHCGLKPGKFVHTIGDAHIYADHISALKHQISREERPSPKFNVLNNKQNLEDYVEDDFKLEMYIPHGAVYMNMTA